jgi:hypothetical protein
MAKKVQQVTWTLDGEIHSWMFYCPGCKENHAYLNGRWQFNGDIERPTFRPSLLYAEKPIRCHLHVTDGRIEYCSDCDHELAGKVIDVPDWED